MSILEVLELNENISGANQLLANHANFNMSHLINIHGVRRGRGRGDLKNCDSRWEVNCKIIQSLVPLGDSMSNQPRIGIRL